MDLDCEIQKLANNVFITNLLGARTLDRLVSAKITHIVVCTNDLPFSFPDDFKYIRFNLGDSTTSHLLTVIPDYVGYIRKVVLSGGNVLVHCAAGVSRSATLAIAYKMAFEDMTLEESLAQAVSRRPIIAPNEGYIDQLKRWENMGRPVNLA